MFSMPHPDLEDHAIQRKPRPGKCPASPFANGWHRVGLIPYYSVLDNGLAGDSCRWMCLHCERVFHRDIGAFVPKRQPGTLGRGR